jgi:Holliday junction resolvase
MRRAARTDRNQNEIAAAFQALGCSIYSLAAVGNGVPDLLVGCHGQNLLIEVKDGAKSKSRRALTPDQQKFKDNWRGIVWYVDKIGDVELIVNAVRRT